VITCIFTLYFGGEGVLAPKILRWLRHLGLAGHLVRATITHLVQLNDRIHMQRSSSCANAKRDGLWTVVEIGTITS